MQPAHQVNAGGLVQRCLPPLPAATTLCIWPQCQLAQSLHSLGLQQGWRTGRQAFQMSLQWRKLQVQGRASLLRSSRSGWLLSLPQPCCRLTANHSPAPWPLTSRPQSLQCLQRNNGESRLQSAAGDCQAAAVAAARPPQLLPVASLLVPAPLSPQQAHHLPPPCHLQLVKLMPPPARCCRSLGMCQSPPITAS